MTTPCSWQGSRACCALRADIDVATAANAASARAAMRESDFDLVVVDLDLPDASGHDLLRDAAQAGPNSRWIVISGSTRMMDVYRTIEAGALGFINKTARDVEIRCAMETVLAGGRVLLEDYDESRVEALAALS